MASACRWRSAEGLDRDHLGRFRALIERTDPFLVSDHLSWSVTGGVYLNDLLPLPYTDEALAVLERNISAAQEAFGRRILIEIRRAISRSAAL